MRVFSPAFFKPRFCSCPKRQLATSFVVPNYSHDVAFWPKADIPHFDYFIIGEIRRGNKVKGLAVLKLRTVSHLVGACTGLVRRH